MQLGNEKHISQLVEMLMAFKNINIKFFQHLLFVCLHSVKHQPLTLVFCFMKETFDGTDYKVYILERRSLGKLLD